MKHPVGFTARRARRAARYAAYLAVSLLVGFAALHLTARALLPQLAERKGELEAFLSEKADRPVRIETLEAYWDGVYPGARLRGIHVSAGDGREAVRLAEVELTVRLLPLLRGEFRIHRLVLAGPSLTLERGPSGRIRLLGFELDPADLERPRADDRFTAFLFQQGHVVIRDGELTWVDAHSPNGPLQLTEVQLSLRNSGERHRLDVTARFPETMCRECRFSADIDGDPFSGPDWEGEIRIEAKGLDVSALPAIVRERLPAGFSGRFDARLWTDWDRGWPRAVRGPAAVSELRLPLPDLAHPLAAQQAAGDITWMRRGDGWQLDVEGLSLGLAGAPWEAGRLRLAHSPEHNLLQVKHVNVSDVTAFVAGLEGAQPWLHRWVDLHPEGALENVDARIRGPLNAPSAYTVRADLRRAGFAAYEQMPGVRGATGRIEVHNGAGELALDAHGLALDLPRVFRAPLAIERARGKVVWERTAEQWAIEATDLRIAGEDGEGNGALELLIPHDRARSPVLKLRADFRNGNGAHAARYYPIHHLPARMLAWMESAFVDGRITSGSLLYDGPIREFPFEAGQGRFELRGRVTEGVYRFLPGWAPVTQADVDVDIRGSQVRVTGKGRIGTLAAQDVTVEVSGPRDSPERAVHVAGTLTGPVAETVRVLREVEPARPWRAWLPEGARASGEGTLGLRVQVPLKRKGYMLEGEYRVTNAAARIDGVGAAEGLDGEVRFNERGLVAGQLAGRLFGGALLFAAETRNGRLRVVASGEAHAPQLLHMRPAIAARLSGWVPWTFALEAGEDAQTVRFEAPLARLGSRLPAPFGPNRLGEETLVIRTELSRPNVHVLDVKAGGAAAGKLVFMREDAGWRFARGRIDLGTGQNELPSEAGLYLNAVVDAIDVDEWLPLLGGDGGAPASPSLARVRARVDRFDAFDRSWGRAVFDLRPAAGGWQGTLDGQAAAGRVSYTPASRVAGGSPARFDLDLLFLRLPPKKHPGRDTAVEPERLPAITLRAGVLQYEERTFGAAALRAFPIERGWRVERFGLERPETRISGRGVWWSGGGRPSTEVYLELASTDVGAMLAAFGAPDQMAQGEARLSAQLAWPGSPSNPAFAGLDGEVTIAADKGRFLQVKPGAARLFGLLELRSIARYFTLDFSPAFGKGLAFDEIRGTVRIERGNAYTQDMTLKGPSLGLVVNGRIGLAAEDYDLLVEVSPKISDAVTLTSWGLFGPQAAAAALAIQKIFKKQIASGTRITYMVKGPWSEPTVSRLGKPAAEPETADGGG